MASEKEIEKQIEKTVKNVVEKLYISKKEIKDLKSEIVLLKKKLNKEE
jgi:polyhydroxyalkanoate synthesis regulator phasin